MKRTPAEQWTYCRDLMIVLVGKELKARYKSTVLGYTWSLLHPLTLAAIFFFVFRIVARIQIEDYVPLLITGLFPWQWFQNSLTSSNNAFLADASLIKKVRFPRELLVLAGVVNDMIHFLITIPVVVVFLFCYHHRPSVTWLWLVPALTVVTLAFTYGVSLAIASCNLFFRDLERLTALGVMLWFYLTPVLFPASMVPERYHWLTVANPMAPIIISWRDVFMSGAVSPARLGMAAGYAVVALALGRGVYRAVEWRFAEVV